MLHREQKRINTAKGKEFFMLCQHSVVYGVLLVRHSANGLMENETEKVFNVVRRIRCITTIFSSAC